MPIPLRIIRTVPEQTTEQVEHLWKIACDLHPDWDHITIRDGQYHQHAIERLFPLSSGHWESCGTGAQKSGLIRLEELYWRGGIYIDSDYECWRPFDQLKDVTGFVAYEDANTIPDAVMGFEKRLPIVRTMLEEAISLIDSGAWESGPGVITRNLRDQQVITVLPSDAFYPYHYSVKRRYSAGSPIGDRNLARLRKSKPFSFGAHHWHASWVGK